MALDLLATCSLLSIKHRPADRVQLRASIHSGSVIAGIQVVGSKMPRYRLFGDTVDVAGMMNTTGEALKIHISLETKLLLDIHGCFKCEHRGSVDIKGKGMVDSYWLLSKEGGISRTDKGGQSRFHDTEGDSQYLRDLPNYNSSSENA